MIDNGTYPTLYWNLEELDYDDYVRRHMIGINKYLHREKFTVDSNKLMVTRWVLSILCAFHIWIKRI